MWDTFRIVFLMGLAAGGLFIDPPVNQAFEGRQAESGGGAIATGRGTIEGTVFYRNDAKHTWRYARFYVRSTRTGELAEAVVALNGPGLKGPGLKDAGSEHAGVKFTSRVTIIDQKEMRFVPETVAIRAGDRVRFTNSDPQTHNIALNDPRRQFSDTIGSGQEAVETFPRASGIRRPFALACSLHSQMQGWIYVFNHPYYQVTGVDGRFRLENIPPGDYRLDLAHSAGDLHASRTIQVKANQTLKIEIVLTPTSASPVLTPN
jgi:plastocyanin